eukprot:726249-Hanusia_phi.AAC.1
MPPGYCSRSEPQRRRRGRTAGSSSTVTTTTYGRGLATSTAAGRSSGAAPASFKGACTVTRWPQ